MNPKISKVSGEIEKTREKIAELQSRLRELERQKTEFENADIVAMVRGIDVQPDEFEAFVRAYREQKNRPAPETPASVYSAQNTEKEDSELIEN